MPLFQIEWGLVSVYVIADTLEEALTKIRKPDSIARKDYPKILFENEPDCYDQELEMMTHYGWD